MKPNRNRNHHQSNSRPHRVSSIRDLRSRRVPGIKNSVERYYREIGIAKELGHNAPKGIRILVAQLRKTVHEKRARVLDFEGWSLPTTMAYLFLVNGEFHQKNSDPHMKLLKYAAQLHLLKKHSETVMFVTTGAYKNCYQIAYDFWTSHWPRSDEDHPANRLINRCPVRYARLIPQGK